MFFQELLAALADDLSGMVRSSLRIVHFLGLALGLGTATVMDLLVVRFFLGKTVTDELCEILSFCRHLVTIGLVLLWTTGLGFLLYYYAFAPDGLTNEKIIAKMVIVAILSINGIFIHTTVLPLVEAQKGKPLLEGVPLLQQRVLVASALISGVSWYGPLCIAGIPQLSFTVPAVQILAIYAIVLAAALLVSQLILSITSKRSGSNSFRVR